MKGKVTRSEGRGVWGHASETQIYDLGHEHMNWETEVGLRVWGQSVNKVRAEAPRAPTSRPQLPPWHSAWRWPKAQSFQTSARYRDITPMAPQQGKSILTFLKKKKKVPLKKPNTTKYWQVNLTLRDPWLMECLLKGQLGGHTCCSRPQSQRTLGPGTLFSTWLSHPTDSQSQTLSGKGTWSELNFFLGGG